MISMLTTTMQPPRTGGIIKKQSFDDDRVMLDAASTTDGEEEAGSRRSSLSNLLTSRSLASSASVTNDLDNQVKSSVDDDSEEDRAVMYSVKEGNEDSRFFSVGSKQTLRRKNKTHNRARKLKRFNNYNGFKGEERSKNGRSSIRNGWAKFCRDDSFSLFEDDDDDVEEEEQFFDECEEQTDRPRSCQLSEFFSPEIAETGDTPYPSSASASDEDDVVLHRRLGSDSEDDSFFLVDSTSTSSNTPRSRPLTELPVTPSSVDFNQLRAQLASSSLASERAASRKHAPLFRPAAKNVRKSRFYRRAFWPKLDTPAPKPPVPGPTPDESFVVPKYQHIELVSAFAAARIPFKLAKTPSEFSRNLLSSSSFLMDIRRKKRMGANEFRQFVIVYFGGVNEVKVLSLSTRDRRLLISVRESPHILHYTEDVYVPSLGKKIAVNKSKFVDSSIRYFLIGFDEGHLFMCQLPGSAKTIDHAHRILKPLEIRNRKSVKRQGEWFFVPTTLKQSVKVDQFIQNALLAQAVRTSNTLYPPRPVATVVPVVKEGTALEPRGGGRSHIAQQRFTMTNKQYCQGSIAHPDHYSRFLSRWHRVYRNTEVLNSTVKGQTWVD